MEVLYPKGPSHPKLAGQTMRLPQLEKRPMTAKVDYIQRAIVCAARL